MNDLYPEIFASAHKKKKHKPPQTSAQLSMYVLSEIKKKERWFFLLAVFLSAFSLACIGYGVNILFEDVLSARSDELFASTAVYIVLMTVAYFLLSFGKRLITEKVSFSLSDKISSRAEQTIRQRRCRHVSGFIEFTRLFVSATVYNSAVFSAACVITVFQLIVVFIFSAAWGYVLTGAVALSLIFFVLTEKNYADIISDTALAESRESEFNRKVFDNADSLAPFRDALSKRHARLYSSHAFASLNPPLSVKIRYAVFFMVFLFAGILGTALSVDSGEGAVASGLFSCTVIFLSVMRMAERMCPLAKNKAYAKVVLPLFSSSAEGIDVQDTSIDIDRLSFSYGDKKIFESLDLHVEKGEKLAVLGSSGSGKSTLYELLRGGLVPDSGAVCIGGADVRALSAECLGRLIATVDPFDKLLSGSIEENILPAENRDTFVVQEEIQRAGLNKMVNDLPQGVNTLLNCGGTGLSETERLKLIFARATARKAPVVLLDGVLDTADNKTRKRFTDALLSLPSTVIVFTAREEVAKCFSSALRLPDGKI